jgi:hypothetical protein
MSDYGQAPYRVPPTKRELMARIARGEVLRNVDALIAETFLLGKVTRSMHSGLILVPNGEKSRVVFYKARKQE